MAQFPTAAQARPVDPVLRGRLTGAYNSMDSYIADRVLPKISGVAKTGTLLTISRASTFGDGSDNLARASGGEYHRHKGAQMGTDTWQTKEYGDEVAIDLGDIQDMAELGDLKYIQSQVCLENLKIWQERRMAALLFDTGVFTTNTLIGGNKWSASTSDPVANLVTAARAVRLSGKKANTVVIGSEALFTAQRNAALAAFANYNTDRNFMPMDALQAIFSKICGGDVEIFVGDALYNTANPGQTAVIGDIWGDALWLGYLNRDSEAGAATNGGQDVTTDASAAVLLVQDDLISEEYDLPSHNSVVVRHRHKVAEKVTNAVAGYIINDIT